MRQRRQPRIEKDLFANMPSEIIIEILSRLPVRTIIRCKCVRKSWLALLETQEFAKSNLRYATPGLALIDFNSNLNKILEFNDDGQNHRHVKLPCRLVTNFSLPAKYGWIGGSVNGLLFLCNLGQPFVVCICNPITRDYIELDCTKECPYSYNKVFVIYGFGVSKIAGQHKVVMIFQDCPSTSDKCVCHVYTMETNLWRRIPHVSRLEHHIIAVFLNGNLHWLMLDLKDSQQRISCFDLETELFSSFSSPLPGRSPITVGLSALWDCLCLCDSSNEDGTTLWLMKEYGVENSWIKYFIICKNNYHEHPLSMYPIKVFKDGDILMVWGHMMLFYYSKNAKVYEHLFYNPPTYVDTFIHTPSFLSLKSFGMENVRSF